MRRLVIAATFAALACGPQPAKAAPVNSHLIQSVCSHGSFFTWPLFGEARSSRSDFARVSVLMPCFFEDALGRPLAAQDWSGLDEALAHARARGQRVLGVLIATPKLISKCPDAGAAAYHCAPANLTRFGEMAGEIAHRARGTITHWEILNEPDQAAYFSGTPEEYAHMLRAAHDGIKARVPEARIVLGGLSRPRPSWMARVFATPGAEAASKFDVGSIHLRGRAHVIGRHLASWRRFLSKHGFDGPVWVTEHGYPGDPEFQYDSRFAGGLADQAAYLTESALALGLAGAKRVFVTLNDMSQHPKNAFSSEGVTQIQYTIYREQPVITRRPAFYAVRRLNRQWPRLLALARRQRKAARSHPRLARSLARRIAGPFPASGAP